MATAEMPPSDGFEGSPRIGGLLYRNALPLQHGLTVGEMTPSALAAAFRGGSLDAALLPLPAAFEFFPDARIAGGVGICADGPVHSVVIAYRGEWKSIRTVQLDPASRTSSLLLEVLDREFWKKQLRLEQSTTGKADPLGEDAGRLVIGDPAVELRATAGPEWNFLDLAEEWKTHTGLPFVFAVWSIRASHPNPRELARRFREVVRNNLENQEAWLPSGPRRDFWITYFSLIQFQPGDREMQGARRFLELTQKHALIERRDTAGFFQNVF